MYVQQPITIVITGIWSMVLFLFPTNKIEFPINSEDG